MKIGITGASGFIGAQLVVHFIQKGHNVLLMQRSRPEQERKGTEYFHFDLENPALPVDKGLDTIIHCAVMVQSKKQPNAYSVNVAATTALQEFCNENDIHLVFLSTMSAHQDALSVYGKHKFELESKLNNSNETVLKLGLVVGSSGGLFNTMVSSIMNSSFVPLIDGGKQPIQTLYIEDLCALVDKIGSEKISGQYFVGTETVYTMKELYEAVAVELGKKIRFISLPYWIINMILSMAEAIGLQLLVGKENLLGLKQLKSFKTRADLQKLGIKVLDMHESINKALHE